MDANGNSYKLLCEACTNHNCTRLLSRFVVIAACSGLFHAQIYDAPGDKLIPCHDRLPWRLASPCIFFGGAGVVAFLCRRLGSHRFTDADVGDLNALLGEGAHPHKGPWNVEKRWKGRPIHATPS